MSDEDTPSYKRYPFSLTFFFFLTICIDVNIVIKPDVQLIHWTYKNPARESYFVGTPHRAWHSRSDDSNPNLKISARSSVTAYVSSGYQFQATLCFCVLQWAGQKK